MRRASAIAAAVLGIAGAAGLADWGCATLPPPVARAERPFDYTPDGGWATYPPEPNPYEPDPARAVLGNEHSITPSAPIGTGLY